MPDQIESHEAARAEHKAAKGRRDDLVAQAKRIKAQADAAARDMTEDEYEQFDAAMSEVEKLDLQLERANRPLPAQTAGWGHTEPKRGARDAMQRLGQSGVAWRERPRYCAADLDNLDDGGFRSFGEFLAAIKDTDHGKYDQRLDALVDIQAAQGGTTGSAGGFIVPEQFRARLIMTADDAAPWLAERQNFEVISDSVTIPALDDRDRSNEDVAGIDMPRIGENSAITADTTNLKARNLKLKKAASLVLASNELLEDSAVGVDAMLNRVFARKVQMRQTLDFLEGSGSGEPLGILNADATHVVAKESMQAADTINGANIKKVRARIKQFADALWIAHPSAYVQLVETHLALTNTDLPLFAPGSGTDAPDTLAGRPIFFHESARTLGDEGDISLVVPSAYLYVSRPLRIESSRHYKFGSDQMAFRVVLRDDGMPVHDATLTDVRSYESSEFVTLAERA